jgi:tetratricopeptide (TPR) repeat protein
MAVGGGALGCGAGGEVSRGARPSVPRPTQLALEGDAYESFDRAFVAMNEHDSAQDWNDATCDAVAAAFVSAWRVDDRLREGLYNARVAHLRCGHLGEARKHFLASLETSPRLYRGQVRLTVLQAHHDRHDLAQAVGELSAVALDSGFSDVSGLVQLAAVEVEHGSALSEDDARPLFASAARHLGRALTVDEQSAPALNQLALLHLARAKPAAHRQASSPDEPRCRKERAAARLVERPAATSRKELELAMGVCLQGMREHPTYGAIRNTAGLVEYELRNVAGAIRNFEAAADLDPTSLEARANLAAALLAARKFEAAERAYDAALLLSADDYEAHLGRALARRGQINAKNFTAQVESVESDLERCKALDPERPEAYYDDAVLNEKFKAPGAPREKTISALKRARLLFDTFLAKAGERPEYAAEVRLAKQRLRDIAAPGVTDCQ